MRYDILTLLLSAVMLVSFSCGKSDNEESGTTIDEDTSKVISGTDTSDVNTGNDTVAAGPIEQTKIGIVELMPRFPSPYKMLDWRQKALDFDAYVFNEDTQVNGKSLIWFYNSTRNTPQETFGIYTTIDDSRQGPGVNEEGHEAINALPALIGATLVGIDKSNQDGHNYVKMVQSYFNSGNGWNVMMNATSASGGDWWYIVFPNVLYYALCDLYPDVDGAREIQKTIADQFAKADEKLNGNYSYSYFNYQLMTGVNNSVPAQQDAACGHAWVLYAAWKKFGDENYLKHAKSALDAIYELDESRFYEILMPFGALVAAQMNAEQGTEYDVGKFLNWTFDGCKSTSGRYGWGIFAEKWNGYDVSGLEGAKYDKGGYAFLMNSFETAWPIVPVAKYDPQYARAIGKWMLNLANACRFFYPTEIDDEHQWLPEMKNLTNGNIAYEGLRRYDDYGKESLSGVSPVALGDGPKWTSSNPSETMFSIYSSSPVGFLGALVEKTSEDYILKIDCNVTDFYSDRPYPCYLIYNPYTETKSISYDITSTGEVDLYDKVSRTKLAEKVSGSADISLPADNSVVILEVPAGTDTDNL